MRDENLLVEVGRNLSRIGQMSSQYSLNFDEHKEFYKQLVNCHNEFTDLVIQYLSKIMMPGASFDAEKFKNKLFRCEIDAWSAFINLKKRIIRNSLKHFALNLKHLFSKRSDYQKIKTEIDKLNYDLNKSAHMPIQEVVEKYRTLGQKYEELEQERIIRDPTLFVAIVGVVIALLTFLTSIRNQT